MAKSIFEYLRQGGPEDPKHVGFGHALSALLVHYLVVLGVTFWCHDFLVTNWLCFQRSTAPSILSDDPLERSTYQIYLPWFLMIYVACLMGCRLYLHYDASKDVYWHRNAVLYEMTWLCNITLFVSSIALFLGRPIVASAMCVTVGIDQLLWYVDLAVYFSSGKFPIGVSKYVFWPETLWQTRLTCTHHLWTIPLILHATKEMHPLALPLSAVIMFTNVALSRFLTPHSIVASKFDNRTKYLNVNLSHELWKDIKLKFLQINHGDPPVGLYLFRLLWRWQGFNCLIYMILYLGCHFVYGEVTTTN